MKEPVLNTQNVIIKIEQQDYNSRFKNRFRKFHILIIDLS